MMTKTINALLAMLLFGKVESQTRTYTDALGNVHSTSIEKPKIVTWAHRAVTLFHYGLDESQLLGVYGEWGNSGSDLDIDNPQLGSSFPMDPSSYEILLLQNVVNLSPGCGNEYCVEFDIETFKALNPDEFVIHGYRGSAWAINSIIPNITEFMGKEPIFLEVSMDGADECADDGYLSCAGISMIESIDEHFALAEYLNLDEPTSLANDRSALCEAASNFQENMKIVHEKGLRVMPAYLTTSTSYYADVTHDMVLRMFEELGMPIMHKGLCANATACSDIYFWEYIPIEEYFTGCDGEISADCNDNPLYPVDVWLYDHRTTLTITNPDFAEAFPDKAIIQNQYVFWPIGGRLITPFHATKILNLVGPVVASFDRIHPSTDCTPGVDVSSQEHKVNGISPGEYACYETDSHNTAYYQGDQCSAPEPETPFGFGNLCFSGSSTVETIHGNVIPMENLNLGDMVKVGESVYEEVYSFGHNQKEIMTNFIQISVQDEMIQMSNDHMIFRSDGKTAVAASSLVVGDMILLGDGKEAQITQIKTNVKAKGAFAPFTKSGKIVVNNILASNYVTLNGKTTLFGCSMQWLAHFFQSAHRFAYFQIGIKGETYTKDGLSSWIAVHLRASRWMLEQESDITKVVVLIPTMMVFGIFYLLETWFVIVVLASTLGVLYNSWEKNSKKKIN